MSAEHDSPDGRTDEAGPRPAGDGGFALRVRGRDGALCLFNLGRLTPRLPHRCEAIAGVIADKLFRHGLHPSAPDTRLEIEDQDGNLLALVVMQPWAEEPEFALFSPAGDLLTTWPAPGWRES